jgi:hypothetical protein
MDIREKKVMVLGGFGEVGFAICRELLHQNPKALVVTSLRKEEALTAVGELRKEASNSVQLTPIHGNLFVRWSMKDASREEILSNPQYQRWLVEDALDELNEEILTSSTLYRVISEQGPEIIVDCINTATALAYQNIYQGYQEFSKALQKPQEVEGLTRGIYRLLSTVQVPPLIRHVQILYEAMKRKGTLLYLKIGTTGTGGMGLNIPFTHGEEQPSRLLLSKAAVAGAHTLLLFLISRTHGGPIVKELKPAALIGWKGIGTGRILKRGAAIPLYDCPPTKSFRLIRGKQFNIHDVHAGHRLEGESMGGAYVDTGENGLFSLDEFKVVTALGLMHYITPEEIAHTAGLEIQGTNTSKDVLGAMAGAVMGSTYRAGLMREGVIRDIGRFGNGGIAYGLLGPRIAKLIFEGHLLRRCYGTLEGAVKLSPPEMSRCVEEEIGKDTEFRTSAISLGIPILFPDGETLLLANRPHLDKGWEEESWVISPQNIDRWASREWIDLRPESMLRWQNRFREILEESRKSAGDMSSHFDRGNRFWPRDDQGETLIDPGEIAGWILIKEGGGRPELPEME